MSNVYSPSTSLKFYTAEDCTTFINSVDGSVVVWVNQKWVETGDQTLPILVDIIGIDDNLYVRLPMDAYCLATGLVYCEDAWRVLGRMEDAKRLIQLCRKIAEYSPYGDDMYTELLKAFNLYSNNGFEKLGCGYQYNHKLADIQVRSNAYLTEWENDVCIIQAFSDGRVRLTSKWTEYGMFTHCISHDNLWLALGYMAMGLCADWIICHLPKAPMKCSDMSISDIRKWIRQWNIDYRMFFWMKAIKDMYAHNPYVSKLIDDELENDSPINQIDRMLNQPWSDSGMRINMEMDNVVFLNW